MVDFSLPMLCGHLAELQLYLLAVDTVQVPNGRPAHEGLKCLDLLLNKAAIVQ